MPSNIPGLVITKTYVMDGVIFGELDTFPSKLVYMPLEL